MESRAHLESEIRSDRGAALAAVIGIHRDALVGRALSAIDTDDTLSIYCERIAGNAARAWPSELGYAVRVDADALLALAFSASRSTILEDIEFVVAPAARGT